MVHKVFTTGKNRTEVGLGVREAELGVFRGDAPGVGASTNEV